MNLSESFATPKLYWSRFHPLSHWGGNLIGSLMLVMAILSVMGNAAVIYVLGRSPKSRKINLFRINLAISELFSPLVTYWMVITSAFRHTWGFGSIGCHYYAFFTGWLALTSISNLSAVAIERCLVISKPFIKQRLTMKLKLFVVLVTWLYALALAVPPLFGWGDYVNDGYKISCCFDYISRDLVNRTFIFYLFAGGFFIPTVIIVVSYGKIFLVIRANERQMSRKKHRRDTQTRNILANNNENATDNVDDLATQRSLTPLIPLKCHNNDNRANSNDITVASQKSTECPVGTEVRLAKVILIVIVVFLASWLPYAILALIGQFGPPGLITPEVSTTTAILAKISVVYNPFIYGFRDLGFRQKLKRIFKPLQGQINESRVPTATSTRQFSM